MMSRVSVQSGLHPEDRATGENEEEEVDIDVCVAAVVEERPVVGVRRSARLSANAGARQSLHIAQLLQEQTEEEAVYFS
jgi:hypothetical protein